MKYPSRVPSRPNPNFPSTIIIPRPIPGQPRPRPGPGPRIRVGVEIRIIKVWTFCL